MTVSLLQAAAAGLLLLRSRRLLRADAPNPAERWFAWIVFPLLLDGAAWLLLRLYPPRFAIPVLLATVCVGVAAPGIALAALLGISVWLLLQWPPAIVLAPLCAAILVRAKAAKTVGVAPRRWRNGTRSAAAFAVTTVLTVEAMLAPATAAGLFPYGAPSLCEALLGRRVVSAWIAGLGSDRSGVRESAAAALIRLGAPARHALREVLHEGTARARFEAAGLLGRSGDPSVVPDLVDALYDEDAGVRGNAAEALGRIGDAGAVPALIDVLRDRSDGVHEQSARALDKIADERAEPVLIDALQDPDSPPRVRAYAAGALRKLREKRAVSALLEELRDVDAHARRKAVEALGHFDDPRCLHALAESLRDNSTDVRWTAAWMLAYRGDTRAVPGLVEALTKQDGVSTRVSAVELLGRLRDARAVPALQSALEDGNNPEALRVGAAIALGKIGDAHAAPSLIGVLVDKANTGNLRWTARRALEKMDAGGIIEP